MGVPLRFWRCLRMCLTRIYVRRRRDGRLMRFSSDWSLNLYKKSERETKRSLPQITRTEFIAQKRSYREPRWVRSKIHPGMALLVDGRSQ